jgi:hypothetical protein
MAQAKGILWGVVLNPVSVETLFPIVDADHITLKFGCYKYEVEQYLGIEFSVRALIHSHG